jgi:hypothetical protein
MRNSHMPENRKNPSGICYQKTFVANTPFTVCVQVFGIFGRSEKGIVASDGGVDVGDGFLKVQRVTLTSVFGPEFFHGFPVCHRGNTPEAHAIIISSPFGVAR